MLSTRFKNEYFYLFIFQVIDDDYPDEVAKRVEELLLGYSSLQDDCKKENYPIPPDIQVLV